MTQRRGGEREMLWVQMLFKGPRRGTVGGTASLEDHTQNSDNDHTGDE